MIFSLRAGALLRGKDGNLRRWAAFLLTLALLALSGCGVFGGKDAAPGLLETAAGFSAPRAVAEADGETIGSRSYLYWLGRNCAYLAEALTAQGREVQWNQGTQGETLGDAAKSAALRTAALYALLPKLAEEAGVTWEDADAAAIREARQAKIESLGGEDAWASHLARWGLSEADAEAFARCHRLYARLLEESRTEGSAAYLSPEDIAAYAEKQGLRTVALLAVADSAQAEAIRTELAAGADLPAAFAAKAEAVSVWPTQTVTLGLDEALPEAVSQAAKALTPGQLSAVVTAEGRSFLLLGRELDQEAAAQALFDQRLNARAEQAEIQLLAAYEDIDPGKFYPALTAAQAALDASGGSGQPAASDPASGSADPAGSSADPAASGAAIP